MPRPKAITPSVEKSISLPLGLCAKVDLLLLDPLESKIPHGAWSRLIQALLREWLQEHQGQGQGQGRNQGELK